jgi:hypothetical protein
LHTDSEYIDYQNKQEPNSILTSPTEEYAHLPNIILSGFCSPSNSSTDYYRKAALKEPGKFKNDILPCIQRQGSQSSEIELGQKIPNNKHFLLQPYNKTSFTKTKTLQMDSLSYSQSSYQISVIKKQSFPQDKKLTHMREKNKKNEEPQQRLTFASNFYNRPGSGKKSNETKHTNPQKSSKLILEDKDNRFFLQNSPYFGKKR